MIRCPLMLTCSKTDRPTSNAQIGDETGNRNGSCAMIHCPEKARLFAAYDTCLGLWQTAAASLNNCAGIGYLDFQLLLEQTNEARRCTLKAKTVRDAHVAEHGC
jgi:hypothetical protein